MYLSTAISRTTWKNLQKIGVPLQDETLCHSLAVRAASYKKRRIQVLQVSSAQQPTDHALSFDRRPWEIQVHTLQTPIVAKKRRREEQPRSHKEIKSIPHGDQQSKLCSIYSVHFSRANIRNLRNLDVPPPARLGWAPTRVWRHSADVIISVNHPLDKSLNGSNSRYGEILRSRGNMCWRVISDLAVRETGDQAPHCSLHSRQS
jgi:hypothetical protein